MRSGFSKIPHNIFKKALKPLDIVVYCFYKSHYGVFTPSYKYTRRALNIHLHTLKGAKERIAQTLKKDPLDGQEGWFFLPNFIFDTPVNRCSMALYIYSFSLGSGMIPSSVDARNTMGISFASFTESIKTLKDCDAFIKRDEFLNPFTYKKSLEKHKVGCKSDLKNGQTEKTLEECQSILEYYEDLKFKISEYYNQGWQKQEVHYWQVKELKDLLGIKNIKVEEVKGILKQKYTIFIKDLSTALAMLTCFKPRVLFSEKHWVKNLSNYYECQNSQDIYDDEWYRNTHHKMNQKSSPFYESTRS